MIQRSKVSLCQSERPYLTMQLITWSTECLQLLLSSLTAASAHQNAHPSLVPTRLGCFGWQPCVLILFPQNTCSLPLCTPKRKSIFIESRNSLGWKEPQWSLSSNPPAMCRVTNHLTRLPRATSSLALNASRDGAFYHSIFYHSSLCKAEKATILVGNLHCFHLHKSKGPNSLLCITRDLLSLMETSCQLWISPSGCSNFPLSRFPPVMLITWWLSGGRTLIPLSVMLLKL